MDSRRSEPQKGEAAASMFDPPLLQLQPQRQRPRATERRRDIPFFSKGTPAAEVRRGGRGGEGSGRHAGPCKLCGLSMSIVYVPCLAIEAWSLGRIFLLAPFAVTMVAWRPFRVMTMHMYVPGGKRSHLHTYTHTHVLFTDYTSHRLHRV